MQKLYLNHALLFIICTKVVVLWVVLTGVFCLLGWFVFFFLFLFFPPRTFDLVSLSHCLVFMKFILSLVFMKNHKNHEALAICRDIYILKFLQNFTSLERG